MVFFKIYKILKLIIYRLRANYYALFFEIGTHCKFEKIVFRWSLAGPVKRDTVKIGNYVTIFNGTEICAFTGCPVIIGNNVFINQESKIHPNSFIGDNVSIGCRVLIILNSHVIGTSNKRAGETMFKKIIIEDGCWIGANSIILGGITIGKGTIIAAGSVVNKDCDPNCLYAGNPARRIKKLT